MSKCVLQSKLVLNGWMIIKLSNNGKKLIWRDTRSHRPSV